MTLIYSSTYCRRPDTTCSTTLWRRQLDLASNPHPAKAVEESDQVIGQATACKRRACMPLAPQAGSP
jgi:hypothetical protein